VAEEIQREALVGAWEWTTPEGQDESPHSAAVATALSRCASAAAVLYMTPILATAWTVAGPRSTPFSPRTTRSSSLAASATDEATASEYIVCVVGDLYMDLRKMEDYIIGREQFAPIVADAKKKGNCSLVSLGDLGESKSVRPQETSELFAGTTKCHAGGGVSGVVRHPVRRDLGQPRYRGSGRVRHRSGTLT